MTIKVFISGICGSHEVRKHQQRVLFILESLPIDLQLVDITEPGRDEDLNFMQEEAKKHNKKTQLPPQIFNNNEYCGDYADFELANDDDEIMKFLKLETGTPKSEVKESISQNGIKDQVNKQENSEELSEPIVSNGEVNGHMKEEPNDVVTEVIKEKDTELESSENNEDIIKSQNQEAVENEGKNSEEEESE